MTENYVDYRGVVEFDVSEVQNQYSPNGTLILKNHNASGLPEHEKAFEIPVTFEGL